MKHIKNYLPKNIYIYFSESDEKIFIDLRRSNGYSGELEKLTRDDSD